MTKVGPPHTGSKEGTSGIQDDAGAAQGDDRGWTTLDLAGLFPDFFDAAPDGILVVDEDGLIVLANSQAEELFGYDREQLVGKEVEILVPRGLREAHVEHRQEYMQEPKLRPMGVEIDLRAVRADGAEFPVEISLSPLRTEKGLLVMAAVRDVTERREIEREVRRYAEKLEKSNDELEKFAHVVSHDLREPIRNVKGFLELLEDRYREDLPEPALEYVDHAVEGAERMNEMIQGLLTYARVDSQGVEPEPVDLDDVLEETLEVLRVKIEETGASVTVEELPTVKADRGQISRVFQNLLENGIKFAQEDAKPKVQVSAERKDEHWLIAVEDEGIGIDPSDQDQIFEVFSRGTDRGGGQGIGLSVCEKIVERHGGEIWVESTPGKGSTFCFTLPVDPREEANRELAPPSPSTRGSGDPPPLEDVESR